MRVLRFDDLSRFADRVLPLLLEREAENCFLLGRIAELSSPDAPPDPTPLMCAVESRDGRVAAAAMMSQRRKSTRRFPLDVTRAADEAIESLIAHFESAGARPPGVNGPVPTVERFADAWCARTGCGQALVHGLGLYRITGVIPPRALGGSVRAARAGDKALLVAWADAFFRSVGEPESFEFCDQAVDERIREGRLFVWCDPDPVSMAGWAGPTPNAARVNFVYTPPPYRGRGYASACVAALSRHLLDSGRQFCTLFTDLANPTTNRIYRAIGYEHVCDFKHIGFVDR